MKILVLFMLTCVSVYAFTKGDSNENNNVPRSWEGIVSNKGNVHNFSIGVATDFEMSFEAMRTLGKDELRKKLLEEPLNLHQISNALLIMGTEYLKEEDNQMGIPILEVAAYDYHNPLAMVVLARLNFHGYEEVSGGTATAYIKDLEKAYYLINRAFETSGEFDKSTGEKFALDKSVAMGLALLDSYNLSDIRKEFNANEHSVAISNKVKSDVLKFASMYKLSK